MRQKSPLVRPPRKCIPPIRLLFLAWTIIPAIVFFGAVPLSLSQPPTQTLRQQIATMEKTLKLELKGNPRASSSLGLMSQLKMSLDDSNSASITALERGLVRQYDNKHQEKILQIIRTAAKQVEQDNGKLQKKLEQADCRVRASGQNGLPQRRIS